MDSQFMLNGPIGRDVNVDADGSVQWNSAAIPQALNIFYGLGGNDAILGRRRRTPPTLANDNSVRSAE